MQRFILRTIAYVLMILVVLEVLVRLFHLYKDTPTRMIDSYGVEKWVPGQTGFSVTGNRRQNVGAYRINKSGFNSLREFEPSDESFEIALVGDSFIEGFHQDYNESIGRKIEKELPGISVYEFGYAGYDLADELHLIKAYDSIFKKIDKVFIYVKYPDDLRRDRYVVSRERMRLEEGGYKWLKKSKLLVYCQNIGLLNTLTQPLSQMMALIRAQNSEKNILSASLKINEEEKYLSNFKILWDTYEMDAGKAILLLDAQTFPKVFIRYLDEQEISYLDFGAFLAKGNKPVTLIYDQHWNDYGRTLIAADIAEYLIRENFIE